jgi:hypothetical protein
MLGHGMGYAGSWGRGARGSGWGRGYAGGWAAAPREWVVVAGSAGMAWWAGERSLERGCASARDGPQLGRAGVGRAHGQMG